MAETEDPIVVCLERARNDLMQLIRDQCESLNGQTIGELAAYINELTTLISFFKVK